MEATRVGDRVDWGLAAATGRRLSRPGPPTTAYTRDRAAEQLLEFAAAAETHVRDVTGLAFGAPTRPARVVDRPEWISAAAASMETMLGSADPAPAKRPSGVLDRVSALGTKVGEGAAGVQAGLLLAFLSGAILGQFDPFARAADEQEGELLLVAPNVIGVERALDLVPSDFRMWVCLHEVTHRVQFAATGWLAGYMKENVDALTASAPESTAEVLERIVAGLRHDPDDDAARRQPGMLGALQLLQGPEQFAATSNLLMLGTLLEGHADHVMDAVGPSVVPTVAEIRTAFDRRRERPQNPVRRVLRALLGMDAKIAQYVRGKAFVDAVVSEVGMERFNRVWTSPETLPRPADLDDPSAWIARTA
ncbi:MULTISPECIES: zinc-dependent metalloprotease [unclassified Tsukamurella]|uniref:zinc-dependent metalloprotease n=1 Tax=unclassified Tsukamurella TaxID=2633480 RepID=UPI0031BA0648